MVSILAVKIANFSHIKFIHQTLRISYVTEVLIYRSADPVIYGNMCGILAILNRKDHIPEDVWKATYELLQQRGPDNNSRKTTKFSSGFYLHMHSWVLHLRGENLVVQPYINANGDILQWNGDVFGGIEVEDSQCDTAVLGEKLAKCKTDADICQLFSALQGPWSFVLYHQSTEKIWFGRDYFGRRSLLWHSGPNKLVLASVARRGDPGMKWLEIPAVGLFCIDVWKSINSFAIQCYPWRSITDTRCNKITALESTSTYEDVFLREFCEISSTQTLATTIVPMQTHHVLHGSHECISQNELNIETLRQICDAKELWNVADNFIKIIKCAVRKRVINVPKRCDSSSSVGILFSGGIDCTVLALVAHMFIPKTESIDLLNVAFEVSKNKNADCDVKSTSSYEVPDRITGRSSLSELQVLCPGRKWNFIEIDVPLKKLQLQRKNRISNLTYPLKTVLDDSIGCAIWFACNGEGVVISEIAKEYKCKSKILLCGMGADEQLCGYSRHRSAFEKGGWGGLDNEIMLEVERISFRNLGRDNRIIADHGRDARLPYLDENVVSFLNETPLCLKADLSYKRGLGEKLLLRAAACRLGFKGAALLPKRAIQFGSRIAKAESRKEKAGDVCSRLVF